MAFTPPADDEIVAPAQPQQAGWTPPESDEVVRAAPQRSTQPLYPVSQEFLETRTSNPYVLPPVKLEEPDFEYPTKEQIAEEREWRDTLLRKAKDTLQPFIDVEKQLRDQGLETGPSKLPDPRRLALQWEKEVSDLARVSPGKARQQILEEIKGEFGKGLTRIIPATLKTAGVLGNRLVHMDEPEKNPLYIAGTRLEDAMEQVYPQPQERTLSHDVYSGVGQMGSMLVGAPANSLRGALAIATAMGGVQEFDDAFSRARNRGDSANVAFAKSLGYASVAALIENRLGAGRLLRKYFSTPSDAVRSLTAKGVSKEILGNFVAGGLEEGSQRFAQNWIVEGEPSMEGVFEEAAPGAIVEGLFGLPSSTPSIQAGRARKRRLGQLRESREGDETHHTPRRLWLAERNRHLWAQQLTDDIVQSPQDEIGRRARALGIAPNMRGGQNASRIRTDTEQLLTPGETIEGSEGNRRANLEQAPPGESESLEQGAQRVPSLATPPKAPAEVSAVTLPDEINLALTEAEKRAREGDMDGARNVLSRVYGYLSDRTKVREGAVPSPEREARDASWFDETNRRVRAIDPNNPNLPKAESSEVLTVEQAVERLRAGERIASEEVERAGIADELARQGFRQDRTTRDWHFIQSQPPKEEEKPKAAPSYTGKFKTDDTVRTFYDKGEGKVGTIVGTKEIDGDTWYTVKGMLENPEWTQDIPEPLLKAETAQPVQQPEASRSLFPTYPELGKYGEAKARGVSFRDFHDEWHARVKDWKERLTGWLASRPQSKAIVWEDERGHAKALTRNIGNEEKPWRVTSYFLSQDGQQFIPWGHQEYKTRQEAMEEEGKRPLNISDRLSKPVMTEKEVRGYEHMADVGERPLYWYEATDRPLTEFTRHPGAGPGFSQGMVIDSVQGNKIAFTRQLEPGELEFSGLKPTEAPPVQGPQRVPSLAQKPKKKFEPAGDVTVIKAKPIKVGQTILVRMSAARNKAHRAKVIQLQPDGSYTVKFSGGKFKGQVQNFPAGQVSKLGSASSRELNEQQFAHLDDEERKEAKQAVREFTDIVRNAGAMFGWYDTTFHATGLKENDIRDYELLQRGIKQAFKDAGIEGDWEDLLDRANGLEQLKEYVKQKEDFELAVDAGPVAVQADDLVVGDTLDLEGETLTVTAKNAKTGEVTLSDGTKYGVQKLEDGRTIYVESMTQPEATGSTDFLPPEETMTQEERVTEALKAGPKTANQLAEELDIINHNIRRILGTGAKAGKFVKIATGVYALKNENGSFIYVESTDAVRTLPELAKRGVKVDFIFLDPPYKTRAIVGGNRGIKGYGFITPEQFNTVVAAAKQMMRNPDTPLYYMFSTAPSGMKDMDKYTAAFQNNGLQLVATGQWNKTHKDGSPVTNPQGKIAAPEGLALFNESGNRPENLPDSLTFTSVRPPHAGPEGRQSQKPVELYNQLLGFHTADVPADQRPTFVSIDPFAGTGGLAQASVQQGVSNISLEMDEAAIERFIKPRTEAEARLQNERRWLDGWTVDEILAKPNFPIWKLRQIAEALNNGLLSRAELESPGEDKQAIANIMRRLIANNVERKLSPNSGTPRNLPDKAVNGVHPLKDFDQKPGSIAWARLSIMEYSEMLQEGHWEDGDPLTDADRARIQARIDEANRVQRQHDEDVAARQNKKEEENLPLLPDLQKKRTPEQVAADREAYRKQLEDAAKASKEKRTLPKLRPGEKGTGDLLQDEDAPFNLMSERGTDPDRIAKEKADKEAAEKAAKEFADKNEQDLFNAPEQKPEAPKETQSGIHFVRSEADLDKILSEGFKPGPGMGSVVSFYHEGNRPSDFGVGRKHAVIITFEKGKGGSAKYEGGIDTWKILSVRRATDEEIANWGKKPEAPKEETAEQLFEQVAQTQRGEPEEAMRAVQQLQIAQLYNFVVEHVGDLTHRMSEYITRLQGGGENVASKVRRTLRTLKSGYGFEREMYEQIRSNLQFAQSNGQKLDATFESELAELKAAGQRYADAHKLIPVFNDAQRLAQSAAVAIGEFRFVDAVNALETINGYIEDGSWSRRAMEPPPGYQLKDGKYSKIEKGGDTNVRKEEEKEEEVLDELGPRLEALARQKAAGERLNIQQNKFLKSVREKNPEQYARFEARVRELSPPEPEEAAPVGDPYAPGTRVITRTQDKAEHASVWKISPDATIIREATDPNFPEERIFTIKFDDTKEGVGRTVDFDIGSIKPARERTAEEKAAAGKRKTIQDYKDELLKLNPKLRPVIDDFKTKDQLKDAIKRERAKKGPSPAFPAAQNIVGMTRDEALKAIAQQDSSGFDVEVITSDEAEGITGDPNSETWAGFFHDGKAYLIADNIRNEAEAKEYLRHEVAHGLLRTEEGGRMLQQVWDEGKLRLTGDELDKVKDYKYTDEQIAELKERGFSDERIEQMQRDTYIDEYIALSAQQNLPWWKKAVERVREWLSKAGLVNLTNAEVSRILVRNLRRAIKNGSTQNLPGERLVTSNAVITAPGIDARAAITAYHGSPFKGIRKFDTSKIGTGQGAQTYGWGLYYGGLEQVAENYRRQLSGPLFTVDEKEFNSREGTVGFIDWVLDTYGKGWGTNDTRLLNDAAHKFWWKFINDQYTPEKAAQLAMDEIEEMNNGFYLKNRPETVDKIRNIIEEIAEGTERPSYASNDRAFWTADATGGVRSRNKLTREEKHAMWDINARVGFWATHLEDAPQRVKTEFENTVKAQTERLERANKPGNRITQNERDDIQHTLDNARVALDLINSGRIKFAVREPAGSKYTVSLEVENEDLLDWDKPFSEQSQKIQDELGASAYELAKRTGDLPETLSIQTFYSELAKHLGEKNNAGETGYFGERYAPKLASEALLKRGVRGIRYLDQGSRLGPVKVSKMVTPSTGEVTYRVSWEGGYENFTSKAEADKFADSKVTYNYVIFDDNDITITHENGKEVPVKEAMGTGITLPDLAPAMSKLRQAVRQFPEAQAENPAAAARNVALGQAGEVIGRKGLVRDILTSLEQTARPAVQPTTARGRMLRDIARKVLSNNFIRRRLRIPVQNMNDSLALVSGAMSSFYDVANNPNSTPEEISAAAGNALNAYREFEQGYKEFQEAYAGKRADIINRIRQIADKELNAMDRRDAAQVLLDDINDLSPTIIRQQKDAAAINALSIVTDRNRTRAVQNVLAFVTAHVPVAAMYRAGMGQTAEIIRQIQRAGGANYNATVGASDEVINAVARVLAATEPMRDRLQQAQNLTWLKGQNAPFDRYKTAIVNAILNGRYDQAQRMFTRTTQRLAGQQQKWGDAAAFYGRRTYALLTSLQALDQTKDIAEAIKSDPEYQDERREIYDRLNVRDVLYDHQGTSLVFKPLQPLDEPLTVTFGNSTLKTNEQLARLSRYKAQALAIAADPETDPARANAIEATLPLIDNLLDPSLRPEAARLIPSHALRPVRKVFEMFGRAEQVPQFVLAGGGGPAAAMADASLAALRTMGEQRQKIFSDHEPFLQKTLAEALKSHQNMSPDSYRTRVFNLLAGSRQNFNDTRKLTVGSPIGNGEVVTAEDIAYLNRYSDFLRDLLSAVNGVADREFASHKHVVAGVLYDKNGRVRLPFATGDRTLNRRIPAEVSSNILSKWIQASTVDEKADLIDRHFDRLVMGYLDGLSRADWNNKFQYSFREQLQQIVREFATEPIDSFEHLVNRVEDLYNASGAAVVLTRDQIKAQIVSDFDKIFKRLEQYGRNNKVIDRKRTLDVFGGEDSFNTERGNIVMPPGWYDYGGVTNGDWSAMGTLSMNPFYLAHLAAMEQLNTSLTDILEDFKERGKKLDDKTVTKQSDVQRRAGDLIYSWADARELQNEVAQYLTKLRQLTEAPHLVVVGDRPQVVMTNGVIQLTMSSILSPAQTLVRNAFGGVLHTVLADRTVRNQSLPGVLTRNAGLFVRDAYRNVLSLLAHEGNPAGRALHKLLQNPTFQALTLHAADFFLDSLQARNALYGESKRLGLSLQKNLKDAIGAMGNFTTTGGTVRDRPSQSRFVRGFNRFSTRTRQAAKAVGQFGVGYVDAWLNTVGLTRASDYEQHFKKVALKYGPVIEAAANARGADPYNFEDPLNLLPDKAFGSTHEATVVRSFFRRSATINIDRLIMDYYRRWQAATPAERENLNLFPDDQFNELAIANAEDFNLATFANRPIATKLSAAKSKMGLLLGYPGWTMQKFPSYLNAMSRGSKAKVVAQMLPYAMYAGIALAIITVIGKEAYERVKNLMMEKYSAFPTISQARSPEAAIKAVAAAMANEVPAYGFLVEQLASLGYKRKLSIEDSLFLMSLAKDVFNTGKEIYQSHDAVRPLLSLLGRYTFPLNWGASRLPLFKGQQAMSNAKNILKSTVRGHGNEDELKEEAPPGEIRYTKATPHVNRAMNAIGNGDMEEFAKQFQEIVRVKAEEGARDPQTEAKKLIAARNPVSQVFKRLPSAETLEGYISSMPQGQQEIVRKAIQNYQQAASIIGISANVSKEGTGGGSASSGGGVSVTATRVSTGGGLGGLRSAGSRIGGRVKGLVTRLRRPRGIRSRFRRGIGRVRSRLGRIGQRRPGVRRIRLPKIRV